MFAIPVAMAEMLFMIIGLLFIVSILVMVGQRFKIAYPIVLVIAGFIIGRIPAIPDLPIDPEVVFILFLPPILFEAAWNTHWHEFRKSLRTISLLGVGLVLVTAVAVAYVSNALIPGFTLGLGFLLGGIISPPDAVAATSVLKNIKMPRHIVNILEGESLINDAASLIVVRFALAAVMTGVFSMKTAVGDFFLLAIGGMAIGLAIAYIFYWLLKLLPTTSDIDTALTMMCPYLMYLAAEHFHLSGVMAVVTGGLFLSYHKHRVLTNESRIQTHNTWNTVIFLLNGLIFILIGLQLPIIMRAFGEGELIRATWIGLAISLVCVIVRIAWIFPVMMLPRVVSKKVKSKETNPGWQTATVVGWAGMRGVISLAAALNIPLMLNGHHFPYRHHILYITCIVILVTLVFQGLTLPWIIKKLTFPEDEKKISDDAQLAALRIRIARIGVQELDKHYFMEMESNRYLQNLHESLFNVMKTNISAIVSDSENETQKDERRLYHKVYSEILEKQRETLLELRSNDDYGDEEISKTLNFLDLEELRLQSLMDEETEKLKNPLHNEG